MANSLTGTSKERYDKTIRRKEKITTYLFDLSKASFTMMFVAGLLLTYQYGFSFPTILTIISGLVGTIAFAWFANRILIY